MGKNSLTYYQLKENKNALIIYYTILLLFFGPLALTLGKNPNGMIGGADGITLVFLFILGLNAFKEMFRLALQNGISRKAYYIELLKVVIILSVSMALIDTILGLVLSQMTRYESLFYQMYKLQDQVPFSINFGLALLMRVMMNGFFMQLGLFITIFYYKLTRFWVYVVSISVPLILFIILPILSQNIINGSKEMMNSLENALLNFQVNFFGTPIKTSASLLFFSAILSMGIYLMLRKMELKKTAA